MTPRSACLWFACVLSVLTGGALGNEKPAAPSEVAVIQPLARDVTDYQDFTGRIEAAQSVEIRARATGMLDKVAFQAGAAVKKGDLLFQIDPRPYRAALDKADADVRLAEAHLKRLSTDLERARALAAKGSIGRDELDKIEGDRAEAQAALEAGKAARELVQLELNYAQVTSPIDGRIGRPLLDAGNLVRADETVLATIVSTDPVLAYFDMDEGTVLRLARLRLAGRAPAGGSSKVPVTMGLADESGFPHQGQLEAMDNRVDPATGTLRCRAVFANAQGIYLPGMFARVRLPIGAPYRTGCAWCRKG
jgi:RND family efflux transporter MFP subunit